MNKENRKASIYLISILKKVGYNKEQIKEILLNLLMNKKILPSHYLISIHSLGYKAEIEIDKNLIHKSKNKKLSKLNIYEIYEQIEMQGKEEVLRRINYAREELQISEFLYAYIYECTQLENINIKLIMKGLIDNMKTMTITINNLDEKSLYETLNKQKDKIDYLNYLVALDSSLNDREYNGIINCYETKEVYKDSIKDYKPEVLEKEMDNLIEQIANLVSEIDKAIPALYKGAELDEYGYIDIGEYDIASYLKLITDRLVIVKETLKDKQK